MPKLNAPRPTSDLAGHGRPEIRILRGIPGMAELEVNAQRSIYPDTAIDLAKVIRQDGYAVVFEDPEDRRMFVSHKAADIWLPIIQVSSDLLVGISGGLFTALILDLLGKKDTEESILHVEYEVVDKKGNRRRLRSDGPGPDVIKAIAQFEVSFGAGRGIEEADKGPSSDRQGDDDGID